MKFVSLLYLALGCSLLVGCLDETKMDIRQIEKAYKDARNDALSSVVPIREFHEIYPDALGSFSYFTGEVRGTIWNSTTYLYDRYELTMQIPVELSQGRDRVLEANEPKFYLVEVVSIVDLGGTRFELRYGQNWQFGRDKWDELKRVDGRIELVFPNVSVDDPVPLFDKFEEHVRWVRSTGLGAN